MIFCLVVISLLSGCAIETVELLKKKDGVDDSKVDTGVSDSDSSVEDYTTPDVLSPLLGISTGEIDSRIAAAAQDYFYGGENQAVYVEFDDDESYILAANAGDIRSEGMGWGMQMAAQLNMKDEFDKLWSFARQRMQHGDGPYEGLFCWHADLTGNCIEQSAAPDGIQNIAFALFLASSRFGNDTVSYEKEAQALLDHMLAERVSPQTRVFNEEFHLPVAAPVGDAGLCTKPAHIMPAFYELWARWDNDENGRRFWEEAADAARTWLVDNAHPATGFHPDKAQFDGSPISGDYSAETSVVIMHLALDHLWHGKNSEAEGLADTQLSFLASKGGVGSYYSCWTIDGTEPTCDYHADWSVATNAAGASIATVDVADDFLMELVDLPLATGDNRYYENSLALLALLITSGRFSYR